jgi:BirA family biotin operon repressor/biotin-[acetyl-CoA-carboxylase] ligase
VDDLSAPRLLSALQGTRFQKIEVYATIPSTQTMLVAQGGPDGRVVIADHQASGRGRAGRTWSAEAGGALMFSALLGDVRAERAPLVGLAAGVAVCRAVEALTASEPRLKWPNDVQVGGRKVCGILGELTPDGEAVVVGIGVNVRAHPSEVPEATDLRTATGADVRRDDLLAGILKELDVLAGAEDWLDEYRARCTTIGTRVRVELADGSLTGEATAVRDDGALIVDGRAVLAGDVVHLRNA